MNKNASILATGDVHFGTSCSGIPDDISTWGIGLEELSLVLALKLAVDSAIQQQVSAVVLALDGVESANVRLQAMIRCEEGIRLLLDVGAKSSQLQAIMIVKHCQDCRI